MFLYGDCYEFVQYVLYGAGIVLGAHYVFSPSMWGHVCVPPLLSLVCVGGVVVLMFTLYAVSFVEFGDVGVHCGVVDCGVALFFWTRVEFSMAINYICVLRCWLSSLSASCIS